MMANQLLIRKKSDKKKLYSLHEPRVDCISKRKAKQKYEFGCKVAIILAHKRGISIITSCQAITGNPYDVNKPKTSLDMSERISQVAVQEAYVDKGYRGHQKQQNRKVYISDQRKVVTAKIKKNIKHRQAIELHIGHMKQKVKLGLYRLKGIIGDQINAILAAAAYNLRQILRHIRITFAQILWMIFFIYKSKINEPPFLN